MRWAGVMFSSCLLSTLCAEEGMFSEERLEDFYDIYICEEKAILAEVDLSTTCSHTPTPGPPGPPPPPPGPPPPPPGPPPPPPPPPPGCLVPSSPPNPVAPPYPPPSGAENYMPVRLVNSSGNADANMYFTFEGLAQTGCSNQVPVFLIFDPTTGVGSYSPTPNGPNSPEPSSFYAKPLSALPSDVNGSYMYVPYINGRLYFSLGTGVQFTVDTGSIGDPDPANPSDPSYQTIYDKMEFNYGMHSCSGANQFSMDVTSVDFFGLPIYIYQNAVTATSGTITFPAASVTQGYYQKRDCIIENLTGTFATAHPAELGQWNGLVQTGSTAILRVLSPGESIEFAPSSFDPQYLDNAASYGYSWADNLWTQTTAYYYQNGNGDSNHTLQVELHDGTQYNGQVQQLDGTFYFVFKALDGTVSLNIPWGASTSSGLFEGDGVLPGLTEGALPGTPPSTTTDIGHAIDLSKMMEGLWMTGLIPAADTTLFTYPYFKSNNDLFFQPNTLLSVAGQNTGPWFDLYDQGIHFPASMNNVAYAYPWDDNYYDLPLGAGFAIFATGTYVGIILSPWN